MRLPGRPVLGARPGAKHQPLPRAGVGGPGESHGAWRGEFPAVGPQLGRAPETASGGVRRGTASFTLLEVLIAMMIFFMAIFAILNLVGQNLRIARSLSLGEPDVGTVAAELFMEAATNRDLRGGSTSGDFGELYPGASWAADLKLVLTNSTSRGQDGDPGLYEASITVSWPKNSVVKQRKTQILMYLQ